MPPTSVWRRKLKLKATFEAVHHDLVSSAETRHAFNTGRDTIHLHRHTSGGRRWLWSFEDDDEGLLA
jgi:hypothetical protein